MDVTVEKLIYGGDGLAHHEGATVFVPFVLPKERVSIVPIEQKKKFVRARLGSVIDPSPERAVPPCPHFGICGGCNYQHIPYAQQLSYKADILRETLRRIGKIDWPNEITQHASPKWGYRNRAQWKIRLVGEKTVNTENHVSEDRETDGAKLGIGYFRPNSTTLCAVEECAVLAPPLQAALLALRKMLAAGELPKQLREIEVFTNMGADANTPTHENQSKLLMTVTFAGFPPRAADLAEKIRSAIPGIESLLFHDPGRDKMELFGPGFLQCEAGTEKYRVGHFSFFQVNRFLAEELAREVTREEKGRLAVDIFAGVGLFSLSLAKHFDRVIAVESNPAAARDLEFGVSMQRASNSGGRIEVRSVDVEHFLERCKERPEFVVLDPPRAGITPEAAKLLTRLAPARITYVSCEPPTLARDLALFRDAGYDIADIHLFDLFPQTFHMETIVRLRRRT